MADDTSRSILSYTQFLSTSLQDKILINKLDSCPTSTQKWQEARDYLTNNHQVQFSTKTRTVKLKIIEDIVNSFKNQSTKLNFEGNLVNFDFSIIPGCQSEILQHESHTLASIECLKHTQVELEKQQSRMLDYVKNINSQTASQLLPAQTNINKNMTSPPTNNNTSNQVPISQPKIKNTSQQVNKQPQVAKNQSNSNKPVTPENTVTQKEVEQEFTIVAPKKQKKPTKKPAQATEKPVSKTAKPKNMANLVRKTGTWDNGRHLQFSKPSHSEKNSTDHTYRCHSK